MSTGSSLIKPVNGGHKCPPYAGAFGEIAVFGMNGKEDE